MTETSRKHASIIPGGTIQFLDYHIVGERLPRPTIEFVEAAEESDAGARWVLRVVVDEEGDYVDVETRQPIDRFNASLKSFSLSAEKAVEAFLGEWVPFPVFRLAGSLHSSETRFRGGPTNWCRARLTKNTSESEGVNYHLSLAFDTNVENINPYSASGYAALSQKDIDEGAEFSFAHKFNDLKPFLAHSWVRDWLHTLTEDFYGRKYQRRRRVELEYKTEHIARYVAFIDIINSLNIIPKIKVVDPQRSTPIDVDLVIDIGNARTIGMLIEKPEGENLTLTNGATLELRDLSSRIFKKYTGTFSSNVCFAKTDFGDQNGYSRGSGRTRSPFVWPSVVRIGQEASELSLMSRRDQGQTSLSSPKRYLWDLNERVAGDGWRYAPERSDPESEESPVNSGEFVGFINNQGMPISSNIKNLSSSIIRKFDIGNKFPVTEPNFSRSSMMMFLLSEVISHALVQINSPENREKRGSAEIPRRLTRIIMTVPPAMSVSERRIMEFWANSAINIIWKSAEWDSANISQRDYRRPPQVSLNLDEASATQIVFIYNEIAQKFTGDSREYFKIFGKLRNDFGPYESLRIASIDIGGGTTDMVITTYRNETHGVSNNIVPHQIFRESFNTAGDDILKAIIEKHIIPALTGYNEQLFHLFTDNRIDVSQKQKVLRVKFTQQILLPLSIYVLSSLKDIENKEMVGRTLDFKLEDVLRGAEVSPKIAELLGVTPSLGGLGPISGSIALEIDVGSVAETINSIIPQYLSDLAEIVNKSDCDFLILSGWPSCLPIIKSHFIKKPPITPSRIIAMSDYRIENWYPFSTPSGKIDDPKTTGVVGALLSAISEGNLLNFRFKTSDLRPASTIKFIGPMGIDKQILGQHLLFGQMDISKGVEEFMEAEFKFTTPIYFGYRQFPAERWKTTPFYFLRFADTAASEKATKRGLPYTVRLSYNREFEEDGLISAENEGFLKIEEITAADESHVSKDEILLQLKSLWEADGYWLDTGLFNVQQK